MKKLIIAVLFCAMAIITHGQSSASHSGSKGQREKKMNKRLVAELDSIYYNDQKYRLVIDSMNRNNQYNSEAIRQLMLLLDPIDSANTKYIVNFLTKYGWPGPEEIGEKGENTICIVIQHSTLDVQKKYAPIEKKAVLAHKADPAWYAILEDRIAVREGNKQIYGSQLHGNPDPNGQPWVSPLIDPDHVDDRRAGIGLPPMSEYLKQWNIKWDLEKYKKELPEIEAKEGGGWK